MTNVFMFLACADTIIKQSAAFSYVSPEERVPANHPLRPIRKMIDTGLDEFVSESSTRCIRRSGRPSSRSREAACGRCLLQLLYSIRSERMLMEQLQYNLLFRWFVGMDMDEPVWVPTVYSKNRDRLAGRRHRERVLCKVLSQARSQESAFR